MRSINLDQLRALATVVELGSFSAAARQLNLTQPAISLQVRELEQRFGVKLVERVGKAVHATPPGQELIDRAHRIFSECDDVDTAMRRFRDGWIGRVRIGTTNTAMTYLLPPVIRRLRQQQPGIELLITNFATRDTVEQVIQNRLDLGIVTLPVDDTYLRVTPLRPEQLVAILPVNMSEIPDRITPEYAAQQSLVLEHPRAAVHLLVMQWLARHLPLPRTPMHMGTIETMKNLVELGLGMSIVPDVAVATPIPGIVVRPLDPPVACTMALIEHRSKASDKALDMVRSALLDVRDWPRLEAGPPARRSATPSTRTRPARRRAA
ncbi:MAG TPA: LysR family transcriptional regulator [Vineibacter sp.]|nr:LysR family transcriptional regulator [Vineibacter sp.]